MVMVTYIYVRTGNDADMAISDDGYVCTQVMLATRDKGTEEPSAGMNCASVDNIFDSISPRAVAMCSRPLEIMRSFMRK